MSSNIPKLRFAGFSGEWEDGLIGSKFDFISTNSLSRENLNYVKGSVKNIHYGDIHTLFRPLFDVTREKVPFINADCVPNRITTNNYLQKGDVLFADASEDYNEIGKCIEVINTNNEKIVAGLHTIHARAKDSNEFHPGFVAPLLRTNCVHKQIRVIAQGIKVLSISPTSLGTVVLYRPEKEEQKKIADFLSAVDSRIEGLETMMDLQKRYKQGIMQRIFNQTIRFKDNNGNPFPDWQEIRLGKAFKLQGGFAFKSEEFTDSGIPIIRISNIPIIGDNIDLSDCIYYEEIPNELNFIVNNGDLVIAMSGATTGKTAIYRYPNKAYLNQRVGLFKLVDNNNHYPFIYHLVKSTSFMTQLKSTLVAGAQPNISSKDIESFIVNLPEKDEQKKIADFLSALDTKIEVTQKQLDAAREWKKGLLQKMFV